MPRRTREEKSIPKEVDAPFVETVGEDVPAPTPDIKKSPRSSIAKPTTRDITNEKIPPRTRKKIMTGKMPDLVAIRQRRFEEFVLARGMETNEMMRAYAPDLVLEGWVVGIQSRDIPGFGEPIIATISLVRGDAYGAFPTDGTETSISITVCTHDLVTDANKAVISLINAHRDINDQGEEE